MGDIQQEYLDLIQTMAKCLDKLKELTGRSIQSHQPQSVVRFAGDPRGLSVAGTNLETAMLWVAHSRPQEGA